MSSKDIQAVLEYALENNAKVQAVVSGYEELTETEKMLFQWAIGITQDATAKGKNHRNSATREPSSNGEHSRVQPLVRSLMKTLLEVHPTLLADADIRNLMDNDYCKRRLGLQIGNQALLRNREAGRQISGHNRYWVGLYAGKFYVCKEWWADYHVANAKALVQFIDGLVRRNPDHVGISTLARHRKALQEYIYCP